MSWDNANYLILALLPFISVAVGAWLTNFVFPLRLKRQGWRWEKEVWAKEIFFEKVSLINFTAQHYSKEDVYDDTFSMSGLNIESAHDEITRLVKEIHSDAHKIQLYMSKSDTKLFEQYLQASQEIYNSAKATWGQWYEDDDHAENSHRHDTISKQGQLAKSVIESFKLFS